jgi:hypothetical protein
VPDSESLLLPYQQLGASLSGFLAAILLMAGAWGLGMLALRGISLRVRHPVDAGLLACVLGLDLLSLAFLLTGQVSIPPAWLWLTVLVLLPIASFRRGLWLRLRPRRRHWPLLLLLPAALIPLGRAFCYPVGWDELVYHLSNAQRWLADGRVHVYLDSAYSALPSAADFLFTLSMQIGNPVSPGALNYGFWLLSIAMLYRLLRLWGAPRRLTAVLVVLAYALCNASLTLAMETYVEIFLFLQVLAFLILLRHRRNPIDWQPMLVASALAGFALATKLTALAPLPAMAFLLLHRWKRRWVGLGLATFFLVAGPFYLRPWWATANPCYPFFAEIFTPDDEGARIINDYHRPLTARFGAKGLSEAMLAPLQIATDRNGFDGVLGLQWLVLLPLGLFAILRCRGSGVWGVAALLIFLVWLRGSQQIRFLLPAAACIYLLACRALSAFSPGLRRLLLAAILGLSVYDSQLWNLRRIGDQWDVLLGRSSMLDYVEPWVGRSYFAAVRAVDAHTEADATVLLMMDKRSFYFNRRTLGGSPFFQQQFFTPPESYADIDALLVHLRENEIDYLLIGLSRRDPDRSEAHDRRVDGLIAAIAAARNQGLLQETWSEAPYLLLEVAD